MNFVPARLTAAFIAALASVWPDCSGRKAVRIALAQHAWLPSPNPAGAKRRRRAPAAQACRTDLAKRRDHQIAAAAIACAVLQVSGFVGRHVGADGLLGAESFCFSGLTALV
jgi:hypothetical protein